MSVKPFRGITLLLGYGNKEGIAYGTKANAGRYNYHIACGGPVYAGKIELFYFG
jgi:hypothetical protein